MNRQLLLISEGRSLNPQAMDLSEGFKKRWSITHATSGANAKDLSQEHTFDAIVSELRLPDMTGNELLDALTESQSQAQRFILADLTDRQTMLKCVGTAHQFISKPCDGPKLESSLERAFQLDIWFGNDKVKNLVTHMRKVPSPPTIYFQIVKELQSPAASMENIGALISQDMAVTAKLLQMVNSAAFGLQRPVSSPAEAVMYLGIETTKSLVLLAHTYSHFDKIPSSVFTVDSLWRHSLATGRLARALARAEKVSEEICDQSFTAGLLHDMGKLVLAANHPDRYENVAQEIQKTGCPVWEAEQQVFETSHAEVGAWLTAIWSLPLNIIEALALHHHPSRFLSEGFCPMTAVHVANVLEHEVQPDANAAAVSQVDLEYLKEKDFDDRLDTWREIAENLAPRNTGEDEAGDEAAA